MPGGNLKDCSTSSSLLPPLRLFEPSFIRVGSSRLNRFLFLLSDTSGKRVGPPPEPIADAKRPRVGPPPENPPNPNPPPPAPAPPPPHPQAVQAPLFVPPRARYPPALAQYHPIVIPRMHPAPYVPPLQPLPPLNNNNNNNNHHHHHHPPNPQVNPHHHNMDVMDLPMHYGPPHRYYRRL